MLSFAQQLEELIVSRGLGHDVDIDPDLDFGSIFLSYEYQVSNRQGTDYTNNFEDFIFSVEPEANIDKNKFIILVANHIENAYEDEDRTAVIYVRQDD